MQRTPRSRVPVGLAGVGRWGANLLRCLEANDRCEIAALCDVDPERLAPHACAEMPRVLTACFEEALNVPGLEAVLIATPPATHHELARLAICAGKHVFVEKPVATTLAHAESLRSAATERNVRLVVGHILRYHPAVLALSDLAATGRLGKVLRITSRRVGPPPPGQETDAWWTLAPHDLSVARFLLAAEPTEVRAESTDSPRRSGVFARVGFDNGTRLVVHASFAGSKKFRRLVLHGTERTAVFDEVDGDATLTVGRPLQGDPPSVASPLAPGMERVAFAPTEPLANEVDAFLRAILSGRDAPTDGVDGVAVVAALEAGHLSLVRGGAPVAVRRAPQSRSSEASLRP